jgi:hypothetical protein
MMMTSNMQGTDRSFSMWFKHAGGTNYGRRPDDVSPFAYTAEIAIRTSDALGTFLTDQWSPDAFGGVLGYATPEQVLSALNWAEEYNPNTTPDSGLAPVLSGTKEGSNE